MVLFNFLPVPYREYPQRIIALPFLFGILFLQLGVNLAVAPICVLLQRRSIRSVIREAWTLTVNSFLFTRSLWPFKLEDKPQAVLHGVPPAVLKVGEPERKDFMIMRVTQFLGVHAVSWFKGIWEAYILGKYRANNPISDSEMGATWASGIWATYLQPPQGGLEGLRERWKDLTQEEFDDITSGFRNPNGWLPLELDPPFDGMSEWHYFYGMHGASTWGLFKLPRAASAASIPAQEIDPALHGDWSKLRPAFIRLRTTPIPGGNSSNPYESTILVRPTDKAWGAAKLFFTHGAVHYLVLSRHPIIHFPMDTVNAYTKKILTTDHPLRALLQPHQRFSLPLNSLVLYSGMASILVNRYLDISPFDIETQDIWELVRDSYDPSSRRGRSKTDIVVTPTPEHGNAPQTTSALLKRHGYDFTKVVPDKNDIRNYCRYIYRYYEVIHKFVSQVIDSDRSRYQGNDIREWGNEIAKVLGPSSNFPTGDELVKDMDLLKTTVARVITDISVMHSVDHIWYYTGPKWEHSPWRIRVPPPKSVNEDIDWNKVNTRTDAFKFVVTMPTIFWTGAASSLGDVYYPWQSNNAEQLESFAVQFRNELKALDASFTPYQRLARLKDLAPSIDY
eukprot:TRINITY_DN14580_c0_g1_i1.p1 TRINITY_DN14580_c0_g1~~TRINITY_DN14580_c0_g1_i1.p1  ORF type:complete len:619 (-),score=116.36 TRINITY_DN14580_c0_g1_i1:62-1918(-)